MRRMTIPLGWTLVLLTAAACHAPPPRVEWAIAIHGGAGVIARDTYEPLRQEYLDALTAALEAGRDILAGGGESLDAVETVVRILEDDPRFNAGKGAVFTHEGRNELDAAIMDGRALACGAVTGVTTVKNPITLARKVMEDSSHVFFGGDGAERFADRVGVERVDPAYFFTERRYEALQRALERERRERESAAEPDHGTVGVVALDRDGNLAAGTSTGGLTNKRHGRIGDTPVIGAGTYADNRTCAVSGTGQGEEFIRHGVALTVSALMEYGGLDLQRAAEIVVHEQLRAGDGGVIAVDREGTIAMVFNTAGMFRGAADSNGRFEVAIWD